MEGHPISHDPSIPARFTSHGSYNLVNEPLRVTSWLRYRSLLVATGSAVVFAGLLYTFIEHIHLLSGGITYFWCVIGLLIPLTFGAHYAMEFVRNRQAAQDPNAALICSVEVCINNETVLTVKSWWSSNMSPADAERHGVRVAMSARVDGSRRIAIQVVKYRELNSLMTQRLRYVSDTSVRHAIMIAMKWLNVPSAWRTWKQDIHR